MMRFTKANLSEQNTFDLNKDEFSELFENYQALVYRTAYLVLGMREEAEDALQDVFLKIYQSYGTFDPAKGAFSTWIYRITINHCLKRKTRSLWRFLPLWKAPDLLPRKSTTELEEDRQLFDALSHLSVEQRILVVLRYGWQLPYDEIAQIMGIPLGTMKSRHTKVIKVLQGYFNNVQPPSLVEEENS